jgi:hypothetical protein
MLRFKKYFRRKIQRKNWRFLSQNKDNVCKILIITLVFEKKTPFFSPKIAENRRKLCHNIDPILGEISPNIFAHLAIVYFGRFFRKIQE